jgi:hypothetical protein
MLLDKKTLDMLLSLDDDKLALVIKKIAADAGIPPQSLSIGKSEISGIRSALSMATDSDISRALELIKNYKNGKKSP